MVRKAGNADDILPAENKRMLYGIFQFADVAGPFVQHQCGDGSLGYPRNVFPRQTIKAFNERIHQQGNILLSFRQWRQGELLLADHPSRLVFVPTTSEFIALPFLLVLLTIFYSRITP